MRTYAEAVDIIRQKVLENLEEMQSDDVEIEKAKKAQTIGQLAEIARDNSWDFHTFNRVIWDAFGEASDSEALFNPDSWDT